MECTHLWGSSHVPIVLGRNCYVDSYGFHMRGVFFHTQREASMYMLLLKPLQCKCYEDSCPMIFRIVHP